MKKLTPFFYADQFELYDLLKSIGRNEEVIYRGKECIVTSLPVLTKSQLNHLSIDCSAELIRYHRQPGEIVYSRQTKFFDKQYKLNKLDESFELYLYLDNRKKVKIKIRIQDDLARRFSSVMFDSLSNINQMNWVKKNATSKSKKLKYI